MRFTRSVCLSVGESEISQDASESAAAFIFEHFKNTDQVSGVDTKILKNTFGPFPASAATKCYEIVKKLMQILPDDAFDDALSKDSEAAHKRFGSKIKIDFTNEKPLVSDSEDSEDDDPNHVDEFVNLFKEKIAVDQTAKNLNLFGQPKVATKATAPSNKQEPSWLLTQCQLYFPNQESPENMATALYDILASTKNDAEIQNELFELVGFEAIDLIGKLLMQRKDLTAIQKPLYHENGQQKRQGRKPQFASQITIQVILYNLKLVVEMRH